MEAQGVFIVYERRIGKFGHFAAKQWPLWPIRTTPAMVPGSSSRVLEQGTDASVVRHLFNFFVRPELTIGPHLDENAPAAPPVCMPGQPAEALPVSSDVEDDSEEQQPDDLVEEIGGVSGEESDSDSSDVFS